MSRPVDPSVFQWSQVLRNTDFQSNGEVLADDTNYVKFLNAKYRLAEEKLDKFDRCMAKVKAAAERPDENCAPPVGADEAMIEKIAALSKSF